LRLPYQPKAPGAPAQWQAKSRRHGRLRHVGGGLLRLRAASLTRSGPGRPAASRRMFQGRPLGPAMAVPRGGGECDVRRSRRLTRPRPLRPSLPGLGGPWTYRPSLSASGALDRLCKLGMEQHCKWKVYGTDSLGGKGCTRMRPKLHLPVLGHAFRVTGVMA
jgi:hypothetical protein